MSFDRTSFANALALRLVEPATSAMPAFAPGPPAEPGGPPTPAEVIITDRPKYRWRMQVYRDDAGWMTGIEMEPVARIVHNLPEE